MGNRMPGLEKNMREFIVENLTNTEALSVTVILMNNVIALIVAFFIMFTYKISYAGPAYSRKFNISIGSITIITAMIMSIISNNIALSLGMVGALSIVRFRTAIKDSRDTVYIFWTIIVGICCGVGDYLVAAVGSSAIFLIFLIVGAIRSDNRMLLIIRAKRSRCENIESQVFRYFGTGAVLRVKNTTEENAEYIYELSRKILEKVQKQHPALTDDFYNLGQIESVNIVAQSDEIYN